jgi:hypothetical protein
MSGRKLTEELRKATRAQGELRPVDPANDPSDAGEPGASARGPFGWVSLLVVAALALGGFYVVRRLQADAKLQDCVMSGRKNCAPVNGH